MNFQRLAVAAVAAWAVDLAYGFLVYNLLLPGLVPAPAFFRPMEQFNLSLGFAGNFVGFFVFAYMFAKGYEGGSGPQEGLRFGVLVGLLVICFALVWEYVTMPLTRRFAAYGAVAGLIEMTLAGIVVGTIYKPAAASTRK